MPHLFSLDKLPSLYFFLRLHPEAPQIYFLYFIAYTVYFHRSGLLTFTGLCSVLKGEKYTFGNNVFYFSISLLYMHDPRLPCGFSAVGRHSTVNVSFHLSPAMAKHLLAEAPWAVTPGSWHGRGLCAPLGLRGLKCLVMLHKALSSALLKGKCRE